MLRTSLALLSCVGCISGATQLCRRGSKPRLSQYRGKGFMFKTIAKLISHVSCVQKAIMCVSDEMRQRAFNHDQSKFYEDELRGYLRFEEMPEGLEYGSPAHKEAIAEIMKDSKCFELHSAKNDHHPEYWDYPENGVDVGMMSVFPIIEMVCDWAGAHMAYGNTGSWQDSVEHNMKRHKFNEHQLWVIRDVAQFLGRKIPELQPPEILE